MKKYLIISMACLMGMISCSKEINDVEPQNEPGKITFSAGIDVNNTKATVTGLTITWNSSDKIAVANDFNDEIQTCAITRDAVDHTKCTFTVDAVAGATTYYAICKGSSTEGITFDHTTKTFSGLNLSKYSFDIGELSSSSVSLAGKSTDKTTFRMKPCLTLVRFRMHSESVNAKYADGYSGIRGLYFIAKNGDRVYVAGDYTVNLSDNMAVQYVNNDNKKNDKKIDTNDLLTDSQDYYFTVLPAGTVTSMEYRFLGFNSDGSESDVEGIYKMSTSQPVSLDPGDCFNFGTLNPVGLKKDKDNPAININGNMSDWATIDMYPDDDLKDAFPGDGDRLVEWKATSDAFNIYFYFKAKISFATRGVEGFFATAFDYIYGEGAVDGYAGLEGCDVVAKTHPFSSANGAADVTFYEPASPSSNSSIKFAPSWGYASGRATTAGTKDENYAYVEISLSRSKLGNPPSGVPISVKVTANYTASATQTITLK